MSKSIVDIPPRRKENATSQIGGGRKLGEVRSSFRIGMPKLITLFNN
jgi:hypothetical protein